VAGPDAATEALARSDAAIGDLVRAAGGLDAFLERYAVIVLSDHGQTPVRDVARLGDRYRHEPDTLVAASNRAAHLYRLGPDAPSPRTLAERLDGEPSAEIALFLEHGTAVARRDGAELHIRTSPSRFHLEGDASILDQPDAVPRVVAALRCPNAGDVVVSAAPGWEFADLGGGHHRGGGSHGSLVAGDSLVPVITVGVPSAPPASVVDVAPLVLEHFGVEAPAYAVRPAA